MNLWRNLHRVQANTTQEMNQEKVISLLNKIQKPYAEYRKLMQYYRRSYGGALRADCVGEWSRYIIEICQKGLSSDNKKALGITEKAPFRQRVLDVLKLKDCDTSLKLFLNVVFYLFAIWGLVYLIELAQWGSAGQTSYGLMSVGVLLYVKTMRQDIPLDAFMPFFMQHNNFNLMSLFAVLFPLKFNWVNYDGLPLEFWLTYFSMFFFNLFVAGYLLYLLDFFFNWLKQRKDDLFNEEAL